MNTADQTVEPVALSASLDGLHLIEASAGTGKTWTLSGLFLRLVVERGVAIDRILAVTFTKAATAELRDRIRARLSLMLDRLEDRGEPDDFCDRLRARLPDEALARRRLQAALRGIDEAAIYTIHGFCQRVLGDRAFSTGIDFDHQIATDTGDLLREVVLDFWRRNIGADDPARKQARDRFIAWLQRKKVSVTGLTRWVAGLIGKPELQVIEPQGVDVEACARRYDEFRQRAAELWGRDQEAIGRQLIEHPGLNRQSYNARHLPKRFDECTVWLLATEETELPKSLLGFTARQLALKNKGAVLRHDFFVALDDLAQAAEELLAVFAMHWRAQRLQLLEYAKRELPARLRAQRLMSYDDLLRELHEALQNENGERLAADLRLRYPAALIDEFQDTDPLQWGIVRRIWADGILAGESLSAFLVGDPKQSIYSFRGADVFSYLAAKALCRERHELLENQRSVPGYLEALNAVYAPVVSPFRHEDIHYHAVVASPRIKAVLLDHGHADPAPLRLLFCNEPKPVSIKEGELWAARVVAQQIAALLAQAVAGDLRYDDRALLAGDIAVLVNKHQQASAVRSELSRRGIACAVRSQQSVFDSSEAEQLERLLIAVAAPYRAPTLKAALMSELIGMSAQQVQAFENDEREWEQLLSAFERYRELWRDQGFMRMFREIGREQGIVQRLAGLPDGERRLTNLFHLAELLHAEQSQTYGMESLLAWLGAQRGTRTAEESQLRLESDADLVQIVTVHSSKGLEYPVVFLPFLWTARTREDTDDLPPVHDPQPPHALRVDGRAQDLDAARQRAREEDLSERLRLAYVALTRAKNRCHVVSGHFACLPASPLGVLLHGFEDIGSALPDATVLKAQLQTLASQSAGRIRLVDADDTADAPTRRLAPIDSAALSTRQLQRPLPRGFVVSSYTRLLQEAEPRDALADVAPDHDQQTGSQDVVMQALPPGGGRFAFPRGAAAGVCLHAMLEHIDAAAAPDVWKAAVAAQLRIAGFALDWAPAVCGWLADIVAAPLVCPLTGEVLRLADLSADRRIAELAFHLPLQDVSPAAIAELAQRHALEVSPLSRHRVRGYLRGFIDLCFEHDRRWYIADYKSNWMDGALADYAVPALQAAMGEGDYHLQYLLYTLALHRWLGWRVSGYDYDRHFGGVFYLFLRGMDAQGLGVYATRPPRVLIEALDALCREAERT